ncbi:hypothetical protein L1987_57909 [Smallanthus sonchifolius]|uniref:Uncharacterized protein n=1 Tax=Smallanthus sonchifolius TaxID=185202 RepID=A0ACB9DEB6_9ASTR|nr:hypothetical protein L1987_57909 [Smallanthus sonchifolius]
MTMRCCSNKVRVVNLVQCLYGASFYVDPKVNKFDEELSVGNNPRPGKRFLLYGRVKLGLKSNPLQEIRVILIDIFGGFEARELKMQSRSYTNLLELASGNFPVMGREREKRKMIPRVMTVPGSITEFDDDQASSVASDNPSALSMDRMIIVANQLPMKAKRRVDNKGWEFHLG